MEKKKLGTFIRYPNCRWGKLNSGVKHRDFWRVVNLPGTIFGMLFWKDHIEKGYCFFSIVLLTLGKEIRKENQISLTILLRKDLWFV